MTDLLLAILVPSRGRPHNMVRLAKAVAETCKVPYRIYCRIDDDDPTLDEYLNIEGINITVGPRVFYGPSLNEIWLLADADGCTHLAMLGDDVVPETVGWDRMLIDALGGRLGVAYGSDGLEYRHPRDLPTHYVTQTEIPRRLGWFALPALQHLFLDNVAREIGQELANFQYVPDAKLSHLHPWAGKSDDDVTYREGGANRNILRRDKAAFYAWVREGKTADIAKLLA